MSNTVFPVDVPTFHITVGDLLDILKDVPSDTLISFSNRPIELEKFVLRKIYMVTDVPLTSTDFDEGLVTRFLHFVLL